MTNACLVIGGNLQGVRVALDLAETGQEVYLIEEEASIGSDVNGKGKSGSGGPTWHDAGPMLLKAISRPDIHVLTGSRLTELKGEAGRFEARVSRSPSYVIEELCKGCGECIEACPVVLNGSHGSGLEGRKAIDFDTPASIPFVPTIVKTRRAPCVETCPAHINIQGYVALVSKGNFKEAYDLIRETIPFPSVCGRVCFHPCESQCNRDQVDEPIAINNIKRFVSEYVHREGLVDVPVSLKPKGPKVAIVGSGPAGLTAAHDLVQQGYRVTVFEALAKPGGMLRVGIVSYRLPREILDREISDLEKLGVEIRTGTRIGKDLTIDDLFSDEFESVFVSTGAHGARKLGIDGESLKGIVDGVTFLREVNLKGRFKLEKDVLVIGGGNVALDCARAAKRVGGGKVTVVCLESRDEMPSHSWEIEEALEEGITLMPSLGPKRFTGKDGQVTGLETLDVKHVFDEDGRFNPAFHEGTERMIKARSVICAIGQVAEKTFLKGAGDVELNERGSLIIDRNTLMTTRPGLFAGGDLATGPASVIDAIAAGKRAAVAIDSFIKNDGSELPEWNAARGETDRKFVVPEGMKRSKRMVAGRLDAKLRVKGFEEVEQTYTEEMAVKEAARCLNCGSCSECMECVRACELLNAVDHSSEREEIEIKAGNVVVAGPGRTGNGRSRKRRADLWSVLDLELDKQRRPLLPQWWNGSLESNRSGVYLPALAGERKKDKLGSMISASAVSCELAADSGWSGGDATMAVKEIAPLKRPSRIGAVVCRCGGGISDYLDVDNVAGRLGEMEDVSYYGIVDYACSSQGVEELKSRVEQEGLDALVLAACSCCSLEQICSNCSHQRVRQKNALFDNLGLDRKQIELVNIREHCAWTHADDSEAATRKAFQMTSTGLQALTGRDVSLGRRMRKVGKKVAVIGDGTVALATTSTLVSLGLDVLLLNTGKAPGSGRRERARKWGIPPVKIVDGVRVVGVQGGIGSFAVQTERNGKREEMACDFVVMAEEDGNNRAVVDKSPRFSLLEPFSGRRRGFFEVSGMEKRDEPWKLMAGRSIAMRVLLERGSGLLEETSWAPTVDSFWCRGCGTCVEVCPFDACRLVETDRSVEVSEVDALLCRGCELCVLHCPTGALRSGYFDERNIDRLLEAILDEESGDEEVGKKVIIYACHWCHYGGATIGEREFYTYPPGVKVLRLTCTGRIGPGFILKAFQHGADGVMVMGCPEGDCHYIDGNKSYQEKEQVVRDMMSSMGIASSRYGTLWLSPGDGERFIRRVEEFAKGLGRGGSR